MTWFTDNPLEKLMRQPPEAARDQNRIPAPPGHPCHGCIRYGQDCVAPCYREMLKLLKMIPNDNKSKND